MNTYTQNNNIKWGLVTGLGHIGHAMSADKTYAGADITGGRGNWVASVRLPNTTGAASIASEKTIIKSNHKTIKSAKAWCSTVIGEWIV